MRLFSKQHAPRSLMTAVEQILGRPSHSLLDGECVNGSFLDNAAAYSEDRGAFLAQVGAALGLAPLLKTTPPSRALIEATGFTAERLRSLGILPQPLGDGFTLAIAEPDRVDRAAFAEEGVSLALAYHSDIESAWSEYQQSPQIPWNRLFEALERLTLQAASRGARELFLGQPSPEEYEFSKDGKIFRGSVTRALYDGVIKLFETKRTTVERIPSSAYGELTLSLTRGVSHPIICLWWVSLENKDSPKGAPLTNKIGNSQKTICILDDDKRFSAIVTAILTGKGYKVLQFHDPECFLTKSAANPALGDLLLCDIHMPGRKGTEVLSAIRERKVKLPIIMLTSDEESLLQAEVALRGADGFVRKREDPRVLLAWIENILQRNENSEKEI